MCFLVLFFYIFVGFKREKIHSHHPKVSASETVKLLKRQLEECFMAQTGDVLVP